MASHNQGHEVKVLHEGHIHRVVALMAWPFNDITIQNESKSDDTYEEGDNRSS